MGYYIPYGMNDSEDTFNAATKTQKSEEEKLTSEELSSII
jgi:hypothetical protein